MKYAVQAATFSEAIHVGKVATDGRSFTDKEDATDMTIAAVGQYVATHFDGGMTASFPRLGIEVEVKVRAIPTEDPLG